MTHRVKVSKGHADRLACIKPVFTSVASGRLTAYAHMNGLENKYLPSTKIKPTELNPRLTPFGVNLKVNGNNEMTAERQQVSLERLQFPGTKTVMDAHVCEMYIVQGRPPSKRDAIVRFFSMSGKSAGGPQAAAAGVLLEKPVHVGTVAAFRLGENYHLYRQLEEKPGIFSKVKHALNGQENARGAPKRKLIFEGHGSEQLYDGERKPGVPHTLDLPEGLEISHGCPSGKILTNSNDKLNPLARINVAYERDQWPVYCTQSVSGSKHTIRFPGKDITPQVVHSDDARVTGVDLFRQAAGVDPATGHGKIKNQLFSSLQDIRDELAVPLADMRQESNLKQRGDTTPDGLAFAAMHMTDRPHVDILTVRPGKSGHLQDILVQLENAGILDQYDEICVQACRSDSRLDAVRSFMRGRIPSFDIRTGERTHWLTPEQNVRPHHAPTIPESRPTTVEFERGDYPKVTHVHPEHADKLRPDSERHHPVWISNNEVSI
ncbi:MAG TPA: hypothetical protein VGE12_00995 [Noviherbaspirillum sp.]